jgi:hypothetical protein
MTHSDWSMEDEVGWRTVALRWFLVHGVEANLAEDLTQEALLRLLRGQQRGQPLPHSVFLWNALRKSANAPSKRCNSGRGAAGGRGG